MICTLLQTLFISSVTFFNTIPGGFKVAWLGTGHPLGIETIRRCGWLDTLVDDAFLRQGVSTLSTVKCSEPC